MNINELLLGALLYSLGATTAALGVVFLIALGFALWEGRND